MRKIKANVNTKDRIVCVTISGSHQFYYQPYGARDRSWLFGTKDFSESVCAYFRNHGRNLGEWEYSLTLKELYEFKSYHNPKLCKLMERIPAQVEYVLREYITAHEETHKHCDVVLASEHLKFTHDDYEYAA